MKFKNHRFVVGKEKDLETGEIISAPYFHLFRNGRSGYINSETLLSGFRKYRKNGNRKELFQLDEVQMIGLYGKIMIRTVNSIPADYFPKTCEYFSELEKMAAD